VSISYPEDGYAALMQDLPLKHARGQRVQSFWLRVMAALLGAACISR
jgi:hypothetical protein